jgi:hypothetical protein
VNLPPTGGLGVIAVLVAGAGARPAAWGTGTGLPIFIPVMLGPAIGMATMFIPDMAMPPQQEPPLAT